MSCILKPTMPTSCSSELFVACPTMINVCDWLMTHHTTITNGDCGGQTYHVFAVTEYPIFGSKHEYISTNVGIPLGPLSLELATEIDVHAGRAPHRDQVTISVKYPLLPSVKAGTYKGDLHTTRGITMSVGMPEIYGKFNIWIQKDFYEPHAWLWVEFELRVFGVEYKGKFAVLPIPHWFASSDKLITTFASASMISAAAFEPPSDEADNLKTTDVVASDPSAPGEANGVPSTDADGETSKIANVVESAAPVATAAPVAA